MQAIETCPECNKPVTSDYTYCPHCGFEFDEDILESPDDVSSENRLALHLLGWLLIIVGIIATIYFLFYFNTSVAAPGTEALGLNGRVLNLGLLADRQAGITCGIGILIVGAIIEMGMYRRSY